MLGLKEGSGRRAECPRKEDAGPRGGMQHPQHPRVSLGWGRSRASAGQGQRKGTGSSSFGDRGVAAARQPGSFIFRTGNRCCLAEEASEENKCTLCLPQQEPGGNRGCWAEMPQFSPSQGRCSSAGFDGIALGCISGDGGPKGCFPSGLLFLLRSTGSRGNKSTD